MNFYHDLLMPCQKKEIVCATEEGILVIKKESVALGQGADRDRDAALLHLYTGYGKMPSELNAEECHYLVLNVHTLFIGAETLKHFYA